MNVTNRHSVSIHALPAKISEHKLVVNHMTQINKSNKYVSAFYIQQNDTRRGDQCEGIENPQEDRMMLNIFRC